MPERTDIAKLSNVLVNMITSLIVATNFVNNDIKNIFRFLFAW